MSCQSFNLDLCFCLFGLYAVFDMGHVTWLVPFQTVHLISCFSDFRVPCNSSLSVSSCGHFQGSAPQCLLLGQHHLSETLPAAQLLFLFPSQLRAGPSLMETTFLLSSSIFPLIVSQVCRVESVFEPSFFSSVKFLSAFLHTHTPPLPPTFCRIISRSSSGFYVRAWTLQTGG